MKNLVYIVAIGMDCSEYAKKTWEYWCEKNECDFKVITEPSKPNMAPHWERYTVIERFPEYDNYLYVDADAMVRWNAPNFFELIDSKYIHAVKDYGSLEWIMNGIDAYKELVGAHINWWDYFATGFLMFSNEHREFFNSFIAFHEDNKEEINKMQYKTVKKGFDQTPFNLFCTKHDVKVKEVPPVFSLMHMKKKDVFYNGMFVRAGYVWQFNDTSYDEREAVMCGIWNQVKHHYE